MSNIKDSEFNPNVIQVYTEEPNYTGYKGFEFNKIDDIENLLKSGVNVNVTGATTLTINSSSVEVSNQVEVKNDTGHPIPISNSNLDLLSRVLVTGETIPSGLAVYQTALNKDLDNVSVYVSGNLPAVSLASNQTVGITGSVAITNADISTLKSSLNNVIFSDANSPSGVVVYQSNLDKELDNVSVYVSGNLPAVSLASNQTVGITGSVAITNNSINTLNNNLSSVIFSEENSPSGVVVYQSNLNKDLDNVSVYVSGNLPAVSLASNQKVVSKPDRSDEVYTTSIQVGIGMPGTPGSPYSVTLANPPANKERKELFIQNLSTSPLSVMFGAQGTTVFNANMILAPNSSMLAGDGGAVSDTNFIGAVTVSGFNPVFVAQERFGPI